MYDYAKAKAMGATLMGSHSQKVDVDSVMFCTQCGSLLRFEPAGGTALKLDPNRPPGAGCDCSWHCCEKCEPPNEMHMAHLDSRPVGGSYNELCSVLALARAQVARDIQILEKFDSATRKANQLFYLKQINLCEDGIARIKQRISDIAHWH